MCQCKSFQLYGYLLTQEDFWAPFQNLSQEALLCFPSAHPWKGCCLDVQLVLSVAEMSPQYQTIQP